MKSEEALVGEAVAALRARLDAWDVPDATEKAEQFVRDMIRNGWRPRSLPAPSIDLARPTSTTGPTSDYLAARAARKGATA